MPLKIFDRRARFVVDARLQRRMVLNATLPVLFVLGLALGAQIYLDVKLTNELAEHGLELNQIVSRLTSSLIFFAFAVGYVALVSLKISHRVAGAAYRIRETLKSFRAGNREVRARLREGDFLVALADDVNSFLEWTATSDATPKADPSEESTVLAGTRREPAASPARSSSQTTPQ